MPPLVRTILLLVLPPAAVLVAYAIVWATDSTEGGRVSIPGERVVQLEQGKVTLYYEERRNLEQGSGTPVVDEADFLEIPLDLEVTVRERGTRRELPLDRTSFGSVVEEQGAVRKAFAKVAVPRTGAYVFETDPIERDAPKPSVTIGADALAAFVPFGTGALGALALGALAAAGFAVRDRRRPRVV